MLKLISPFVILLSLSFLSKAQNIQSYIQTQETTSGQKLYLHTDREFYFFGDTLWFSAYLLNAQSHTYILDSCNMYVELIDNNKNIVCKEMILMFSGFGAGFLNLDDIALEGGSYKFRAFTDFMQEYDNENIFCKDITVSHVKNQAHQTVDKKNQKEKLHIDLLPEGGALLKDNINRVAFHVYNQEGKPVDAKGSLFSASGSKLLDFETSYRGLGEMYLIPEKGEKYRITLEGKKRVNYSIPEVKDKGIILSFVAQKEDGILFRLISENMQKQDYYLVTMHRGRLSDYLKFESVSDDKLIKVSTDILYPGINRIILLNQNLEPLSERQYFYNSKKDILTIPVNADKTDFRTREEISLNLQTPDGLKENFLCRASVTVFNYDLIPETGIAQDVRSYLLLDSELKGTIADVADFFTDSDSISAEKKLDLLLLTHGWSTYVWPKYAAKEPEKPEYPGPGFQFNGNVKRLVLNKPFVNTQVLLNVLNDFDERLVTKQTDDQGNFRFSNVEFYDTSVVYIHALNYRNRNNTRLELSYTGQESFPVKESELSTDGVKRKISLGMYRQQYVNELKLDEYYPDRKSRILEEITVVEQRLEKDDGHYRIYGNPSHSVKVEKQHYAYLNVFQFLQGRIAGVYASPEHNYVLIRGGFPSLTGFKGALFLLDGMKVDAEIIMSIPMPDIDKVEILKGPDAAIFGMEGSGGVVSVFTKTWIMDEFEELELKGIFAQKIKGFQKYRSFYSPKYTRKKLQSPIPDFRQTLYWNPYVILNGKDQELSFYSCDNLATYKVIVEGVSTSGRICLGETSFVVNKRNKKVNTMPVSYQQSGR